jgi:hypothetical protein
VSTLSHGVDHDAGTLERNANAARNKPV